MATSVKELDRPAFQTEIHRLSASPEGVLKAPAGFITVDEAGNIYVKTTDETLNTGWKTVTTS